MEITIDKIASEIVEMSLCRNTGDPVRDIYTVTMDLMTAVCAIMRKIREEERWIRK